ncbi:hypothetical protein T4C_7112 [Trichinella pseudospiralis]|uniref:Uncharacterized protein n=1 Tax=Trichinella pseudospiralis TaxID=6337 RepID=A0A0V1GRV0_TRIPS|nr:hypothetical protein T4C_12878 [Trichinella pseudospiralis]KRZ01048.1 hypothetical protein T4C_7112 [Trichinella pseudospiralis]
MYYHGQRKVQRQFIPELLNSLGKIRKFRENVVFSKVDKIGINRFGIKFQIQ